MEWIWIATALGVAFHFWRRSNHCKDLAPRLAITVAANCEMILATYRREIANYLMQRDPDRFLNLYRRARAAESAVEAGSKEDREAQFVFITNRYPFYSDFD